MSTLLVDTNIVSYLLKGDSRALLYKPYLQGNELAISLMTVAELLQWSEMQGWGSRRIAQLEEFLHKFTILPIDIATCRQWATIRAIRKTIGQPISPQDAWIAASALRYGYPLVTHNSSDFQQIANLQLITKNS